MNKQTFLTEAQKLGIGDTPLIPYEEDFDADIFVKNEAMNASGSVKDRAALAMILDAEENGLLSHGDTIVEATSGNMGIALAYVGVRRGYKVLLTAPETMSIESRQLLQGLGAQFILTEGALGMKGSIELAEKLSRNKHTLWLNQFENKANVLAHYLSTGEEILSQLPKVDVFVAGVGTGGTLCGTAKRLKETLPNCEIVAVEPAASPTISLGKNGAHVIQGIGAGFVPSLFQRELINKVQLVENDEAIDMFFTLNKVQGYSCGISAAANIAVAVRLAKQAEYAGKNIVTVFPDGDDRYLSILNAKEPRRSAPHNN